MISLLGVGTMLQFLSFLISAVALAVSAASFYWTTIRQEDNIAFMLVDYEAQPVLKGNVFQFKGTQVFTFMNLGTRPASILSLQYTVLQVREYDFKLEGCPRQIAVTGGRIVFVVTSVSDKENLPLVLKAGEVISRTITFSQNSSDAEVEQSPEIKIVACLAVQTMIPGEETAYSRHLMIARVFGVTSIGGESKSNKPISLLNKRRSVKDGIRAFLQEWL